MELIIQYGPHAKQKAFHRSKTKFRLICTGVGFGKTAAGVNELLKQAIKSQSGCTYAVVAPTFKMLKNVTFSEFFKFCPMQLIERYNQTELIVELKNGVRLVGVAGDVERSIDRARGLNLGGFYGDEIALCPEYMHSMLIARVRDPRGCLRGWYTTTPKGFNWLHRIFFEKKRKDGTLMNNPEDYEIFSGTTFDNPHTPDDYKQNMTDTYVGEFSKQELEGEFVGFEGLVYSGFRKDNILPADWDKLGIVEFVGGIDWGFTNPMVAVLMGFDSDGRCYIVDEIYKRKMLMADFISQIKDWREKYHMYRLPRFYADPSEPRNISDLRRENLDVVKADNQIMNGINHVSSMVAKQGDGRRRLYVLENCKEIIREFQVYRYAEEKEGKPVQDTPMKVDDHAMDSVRYAIYSHRKKTIGYKPKFK